MFIVWPGGVLPSEAGWEGHRNMPWDNKNTNTASGYFSGEECDENETVTRVSVHQPVRVRSLQPTTSIATNRMCMWTEESTDTFFSVYQWCV